MEDYHPRLYVETGKVDRHEPSRRTCYAINSSKKRQRFEWGETLEELVRLRRGKRTAHWAMDYAVHTFGPINHKSPRLIFGVEAHKCWADQEWQDEKTKQSGALKD
jgi:hypothetical protein